MTEQTCEFELDGKKCTCKEVVGIARCKDLCSVHFNVVCKDNIRRFNKGQEIPNSFLLTKKLNDSELWSFLKKYS
jgi:hypothetical protein